MQDYLLYINSHAEQTEEEQQQQQSESQSQGDDGAPAESASARSAPFDVPPPAQLQAPQWASLIYAQAHFYARSLERQPLIVPDHAATVAAAATDAAPLPEYLCNASLFTSRSWGSAHMPVLGLLSAGALPPDLPVKLRSRSSSVGSAAAAVAAIHQRRGQSMEMQADMSASGVSGCGGGELLSSMLPLAQPISAVPSCPPSPLHASGPVIRATHIFPRTRKFIVGGHGGSGSGSGAASYSGVPSFAPGRNPSTLTSTLLFSKLFDGIQGSLSDSGSGANSRMHTPKHSQGDMTPAVDDAGSMAASSSSSSSAATSSASIFNDAFASFSAAAGAAAAMGDNVTAGDSAVATSASPPVNRNAYGLAVSVGDGGGDTVGDLRVNSNSAPTASHRSPLQRTQSSIVRGSFGASSSPAPAAQPATLAQSALSSAAGALMSAQAPRPRRLRQMSLNLLSKSAFEKQKSSADSRLGRVVSALMAPRPTAPSADHRMSNYSKGSAAMAAAHVDLGELSAVGELLALAEWRAALVSLFGTELGLSAEAAPHRRLPTAAFLSLSLLFNIALEECATDGDYTNALDLLHLSGKIYNLPGADSDEPTASPTTGQPRPEREYLRAALRRQPLWRDDQFWRVAYCTDIQHRLQQSSLPSSPSGSSEAAAATFASGGLSSATAAAASAESSRVDAYESLVFELVLGLIHLQLSLGVPTDAVRSAVQHAGAHFGLREERRFTLHQLVANISKVMAIEPAAHMHAHSHANTSRHHTPLNNNSHTLQYPSADRD